MNILSCFGSGQISRPSTASGAASRRPPNFDPTKGAKTVKVGSLPPAPAPTRPSLVKKRSNISTASAGSSSKEKDVSSRPTSPAPARPQQQLQPSAPAPAPALAEPSKTQEENSQEHKRSKFVQGKMRRPSAVASDDSYGQANDPFACTHLTDLMNLQPMESTYRAHSGGHLPEGIEEPSGEQNMRRLYVHDQDRVLLKSDFDWTHGVLLVTFTCIWTGISVLSDLVPVVHYGNPTSVGIEFDEGGEWQFKPLWWAISLCIPAEVILLVRKPRALGR